jgi:hypothetical protein
MYINENKNEINTSLKNNLDPSLSYYIFLLNMSSVKRNEHKKYVVNKYLTKPSISLMRLYEYFEKISTLVKLIFK